MAEKCICNHKRLAMGEEPRRYAKGGMVVPRVKKPMNPVTKLKMTNGVPGMKKGGKCK